jgi:hypothetical protein
MSVQSVGWSYLFLQYYLFIYFLSLSLSFSPARARKSSLQICLCYHPFSVISERIVSVPYIDVTITTIHCYNNDNDLPLFICICLPRLYLGAAYTRIRRGPWLTCQGLIDIRLRRHYPLKYLKLATWNRAYVKQTMARYRLWRTPVLDVT